MNWRYVVRQLCEAYPGMTPRDIGELTLYQLRLLCTPAQDLKCVRIPLAAAKDDPRVQKAVEKWRERRRREQEKEKQSKGQ